MDYKVEYKRTTDEEWSVGGYFPSALSAVMFAFEEAYESSHYETRVLQDDEVVAEFKPMRKEGF